MASQFDGDHSPSLDRRVRLGSALIMGRWPSGLRPRRYRDLGALGSSRGVTSVDYCDMARIPFPVGILSGRGVCWFLASMLS